MTYPATKGQSRPAQILTRAEVRALLNACSTRSRIGTRNRALIAMMYGSGLRISEVLALLPAEVEETGEVRVLRGKGNKARTTALDPGNNAIVQAWVAKRKKEGFSRGTPLFCTLVGGQLSHVYVRAMLHRMAEKVGIEKPVRPHGLRHTYATELAREGVGVEVIQKALGHSSLATTGVYLASIGAPEVIAMAARRQVDL